MFSISCSEANSTKAIKLRLCDRELPVVYVYVCMLCICLCY